MEWVGQAVEGSGLLWMVDGGLPCPKLKQLFNECLLCARPWAGPGPGFEIESSFVIQQCFQGGLPVFISPRRKSAKPLEDPRAGRQQRVKTQRVYAP